MMSTVREPRRTHDGSTLHCAEGLCETNAHHYSSHRLYSPHLISPIAALSPQLLLKRLLLELAAG